MRTSKWLIHTQTHTHTDRYTDRGDDNTRRPKLASGKNVFEIFYNPRSYDWNINNFAVNDMPADSLFTFYICESKFFVDHVLIIIFIFNIFLNVSKFFLKWCMWSINAIKKSCSTFESFCIFVCQVLSSQCIFSTANTYGHCTCWWSGQSILENFMWSFPELTWL